MDQDLYCTTIAGLLDYFGPTHLARILNVSVRDLLLWSDGKTRPPADVHFRLINLGSGVARSH